MKVQAAEIVNTWNAIHRLLAADRKSPVYYGPAWREMKRERNFEEEAPR